MNQYTQIIFYHYILSNYELASKVSDTYFDAKNIQICFKYAQEYVMKYHDAPSAEQLKEIIKINGMSDVVGQDVIDSIYASKSSLSQYTNDWLYDNATSWSQWKNFTESLRNTISFVKLKENELKVENVKEICEQAKGMFNKSCMIDFNFDDSRGCDFWDTKSHKQIHMVRRSTGYPFIDLCLKGGYWPGSLIVFVGAPKIGKSLWLCNLCAASIKKGYNSVYVSLELPEEMITQRIGSNVLGIPSSEYEKYANDDAYMIDKMKSYKQSLLTEPGSLHIKSFPTSSLSVIDLEAFLLEEEDRRSTPEKPFKFHNIFLDYINIMRNYRNPNSEDTYMKIKTLAEDVKAMGIKHGWSIISATQSNRTQFDSGDMSANQVSESTGLGATVDAMFGIIATPIMKAQGVYYLKCIYDRVAPEENKRRTYINDRTYLRLTEDPNSQIEDASVIYNQIDNNSNKQRSYKNQNTQVSEPQPILDGAILGDSINNKNNNPVTNMFKVGNAMFSNVNTQQ